MTQKKPAAKKAATKKTSAKRARNTDGTYKSDDKSTPDVNESIKKPKATTKPGTKATTKPRNPVAKQREATTPKKPYAPKPPPIKTKPPPIKKGYVAMSKDATPTTQTKKSRIARIWTWLVGE